MSFLTRFGLHRFLRLSASPPMAFQAALAKLGSPVKELVSAATLDSTLVGKAEQDQNEVVQWLERVGKGDLVKEEKLKDLDIELVPKTFVVSNYLTAADVALYGALHPVISKLKAPQYYAHPALTRYFDHIQSLSPVRKISSFSLVGFDLDNAPVLERKIEAPKKKEKISKPEEAQAAVVKDEAKETPKKEKKEKKPTAEGSKKKEPKAKPAPAAAPIDEKPVPSMIELKVGKIVEVMKHPDADSLYVEKIDLGEEGGPRTVVSGLVHYIPIEKMQGATLIAVCNLKPANMRGVKSFAMVLCASSKDGKDGGLELIQPPANAKPGDRVYFEGFEDDTPVSQLNPKKKIWEAVQPGFTTLDSKTAAWINPETQTVHQIRTSEGLCYAPTLVGASLS